MWFKNVWIYVFVVIALVLLVIAAFFANTLSLQLAIWGASAALIAMAINIRSKQKTDEKLEQIERKINDLLNRSNYKPHSPIISAADSLLVILDQIIKEKQ